MTPGRSAWIDRVAGLLAERERADCLPPVSSELSARLCATLGVGASASASDYARALGSLAATYRERLAALIPKDLRARARPLRVVSLCTGYDAGVEVLALLELFGELDAYVAVEHDPEAARCIGEQLDALPRGLARAAVETLDVRDEARMRELVAREGPFDLGLALRPPVTATAYADERRRGSKVWLSERVDPPVVLDLINLVELDCLPPLAVILFADSEAEHLRTMLRAVGYAELAAAMVRVEHEPEQAGWHTLWVP